MSRRKKPRSFDQSTSLSVASQVRGRIDKEDECWRVRVYLSGGVGLKFVVSIMQPSRFGNHKSAFRLRPDLRT